MKQHINKEQANELDDLGFFEQYIHEQTEPFIHYNDLGKLLTIGKMIEILERNALMIRIYTNINISKIKLEFNDNSEKVCSASCLCDALHEAIKVIYG